MNLFEAVEKLTEEAADESKDERLEQLNAGIKDEQEAIAYYNAELAKDYYSDEEKALLREIRDDEKDHEKILKEMKAGKKNIKAD